MSGNGQRCSTAADWAFGEFRLATVISRRFRCQTCGTTRSSDEPEIEPGFRLTTSAADELVRLAALEGISGAALVSSTDKATVSRLVHERYAQFLERTPRPSIAIVRELENRGFCIIDTYEDHPVAFFAASDEQRMVAWLSSPAPSVVIVDDRMLPRAVNWTPAFKIGLEATAIRDILGRPVRLAARKMAAHAKVPKPYVKAVTELLTDEFAASSVIPADIREEMFRPGSSARHFIRLREGLETFGLAGSVAEGLAMIQAWTHSIHGHWNDIFSPVIQALNVYGGTLFCHPACMIEGAGPPLSWADGNAAILTLRHSMPHIGCR